MFHNSLGGRLKRNPKEFWKPVKSSNERREKHFDRFINDDNDKTQFFNSHSESVLSRL